MFFLTPPLDLELFLLINQQWRCGLFDAAMPVLSSMPLLLISLSGLAVIAAARLGKRQFILFLILLAGMGLTDLTTKMIKAEVGRVRPLNAVAETHHQAHGVWDQRPADFVREKDTGTSYPSAHASNTMALAVLAMLLWPGLKKWPLLLPLLVGYSRIYLGKHYPTDVLAGWTFGLVVGYCVWLLWRYGISRWLPDKD